MTNKSFQRYSNFELLRLILITFVIILHYNGFVCNILTLTEDSSLLIKYTTRLGESFSICAVNTFVILSGYFLCNKTVISIKKIFNIFIPVIFYSVFIYLIKILVGINNFSFHPFIGSFIPRNYYAWFYCTVFILSPFLNLITKQLSVKEYNIFILIILILFSIIPTLEDFICDTLNISTSGISPISLLGNSNGYTLINFILCYFIGSSIKKFNPNISILNSLICYIFLSIIILLETKYNSSHSFDYCNIFIILQSFFLFCFFKNISFYSKSINFLSKSVWGIFLIHDTILGYFSSFFNLQYIAKSNLLIFLFYSLFFIILTFITSIIFDRIFDLLLKPIYFLINKNRVFSVDICANKASEEL